MSAAPPPFDGVHAEVLRRRASVLGIGLVVVLVIVVAVVAAARSNNGSVSGPTRPIASSTPHPAHSAATIADQRTAAIRKVLADRSRAMVTHDRALFLKTVDPAQKQFAAAQLRMFDDARKVPFAAWNYTSDLGSGRALSMSLRRALAGARTFAPSSFMLGYEIRGFDQTPADSQQGAVFVERHGRWLLASLHGVAGEHRSPIASALPMLWDFGPVDVIRAPRVIVLGPPSELAIMREVAPLATTAIPRVTAVWGRDWARRAVIQVPATAQEMGRITGYGGPLDQTAALTSAEIRISGRSEPVGDRVTINPATWSSLSPVGRQIVVTHELTHVASRADTDAGSPRWLVEGLAEWVSFNGSGVPLKVGAAPLAALVASHDVPKVLPTDAAFSTSGNRLNLAYEEGWLACVTIADDWSPQQLVAFYRAVGQHAGSPSTAVPFALRTVLHISMRQFIRRWRSQMTRQLG